MSIYGTVIVTRPVLFCSPAGYPENDFYWPVDQKGARYLHGELLCFFEGEPESTMGIRQYPHLRLWTFKYLMGLPTYSGEYST